MRLMNYMVKRADGSIFHTTSYEEAIEGGNRIQKSYLTEYSLNPRTEEQEKATEEHIRKVDEFLRTKRG